jgi:hypothetical protein
MNEYIGNTSETLCGDSPSATQITSITYRAYYRKAVENVAMATMTDNQAITFIMKGTPRYHIVHKNTFTWQN